MKTLLITGGAGYIGSAIAAHAIEAGYTVITIDTDPLPSVLVTMGVLGYQGSLHDRKLLNAICDTFSPDAVIHGEGYGDVPASCRDPLFYYQQNVATFLSAMELFVARNIKNHLFSSSAAVYGVPQQMPISETHRLKPISPFGWSKYFSEQILLDCQHAYGLQVGILRYFNAAGANLSWRLGEPTGFETHLIPNALKSILTKSPFVVYGEDYDTYDGTCVRDFVHIDDLARAHILAVDHLITQSMSFTCNLGTARGHSVLDVLKVVESVTGQKGIISYEPRRPGDSPILVADNKQAETLLGWKPCKSDLITIIDSSYQLLLSQGKYMHKAGADSLYV